MFKLLLLITTIALSGSIGYADFDEVAFLLQDEQNLPPLLPADATRYLKLQTVFKHLGYDAEQQRFPNFETQLSAFESKQTLKGFLTLLPFIDPPKRSVDIAGQNLSRYATWNEKELTFFKDRDRKKIVDFKIGFKDNAKTPTDVTGLVQSIKTEIDSNRNSKTRKPLTGIRIALDPGHMGSPLWDKRTGKYVAVGKRLVSEGTIALQTCLLLSAKLSELGATVVLTRTTTNSVAPDNYDKFDIKPYQEAETIESTDYHWVDDILNQYSVDDPKLLETFLISKEFKAIQSELHRGLYFTTRIDLLARAKIVNDFNPHLTIVLHFDADKNNTWQTQEQDIRAYVPGNILATEYASREQRFTAARTLLDLPRWTQSAMLTTTIVKNLATETGVPLKTSETDIGGIRIVDGVYGRNLALNRQISRGAVAYVEVLHYNYKPDYIALSNATKFADIKGIKFRYPPKLDTIVKGLKNGVLEYVDGVR